MFVVFKSVNTKSIFFENYIYKKKVPIVYDFDDAIWVKDVSDANKKISFLKDEKKTNEEKLNNDLLVDVKKEFDKLFKDTKKYTLEYDLKKDHSIDLEDLNSIKINNPDGVQKEKSFVISP